MKGRFLSLRFILPLCLGLRLTVFLVMQPWAYSVRDQIILQNDSPLYHRLACNLLDYGGFLSDGTGGPPGLNPAPVKGQPDDLRTPLYPLFIAAVYGLLGRVPWAVCAVQILLDTLTCALLFLILRRALGARPAAIAALFYALDPFIILYSCALLTEILFLFFVVVALGVYVALIRDGRHSFRSLGYALLGLVLGGATLIRPISQYLPAVLVLFVLYVERHRWKTALLSVCALVVAFALALSPWLMRNEKTFGRASLTYIGAWDLLALNVAMTEAPERKLDVMTAQSDLLAEADRWMIADGRNPAELSNLQKSAYWQELALRYVMKDPLRFGWYHLKGMGRVLFSLGTGDFARMLRTGNTTAENTGKTPFQWAIAPLLLAFLIITYAGAVAGLIIGWRTQDRRVLILCMLLALYFVSATGALGVVRLKLPAIPFYLPFTGIGWDWWWERRQERRSGRTRITAT